jgi:hypothetical protein
MIASLEQSDHFADHVPADAESSGKSGFAAHIIPVRPAQPEKLVFELGCNQHWPLVERRMAKNAVGECCQRRDAATASSRGWSRFPMKHSSRDHPRASVAGASLE